MPFTRKAGEGRPGGKAAGEEVSFRRKPESRDTKCLNPGRLSSGMFS